MNDPQIKSGTVTKSGAKWDPNGSQKGTKNLNNPQKCLSGPLLRGVQEKLRQKSLPELPRDPRMWLL